MASETKKPKLENAGQISKACSDFQCKILKSIINSKGSDSNMAFSPFSAHVCLASTLVGTEGSTRDELLRGLCLTDMDETGIDSSYESVSERF